MVVTSVTNIIASVSINVRRRVSVDVDERLVSLICCCVACHDCRQHQHEEIQNRREQQQQQQQHQKRVVTNNTNSSYYSSQQQQPQLPSSFLQPGAFQPPTKGPNQ